MGGNPTRSNCRGATGLSLLSKRRRLLRFRCRCGAGRRGGSLRCLPGLQHILSLRTRARALAEGRKLIPAFDHRYRRIDRIRTVQRIRRSFSPRPLHGASIPHAIIIGDSFTCVFRRAVILPFLRSMPPDDQFPFAGLLPPGTCGSGDATGQAFRTPLGAGVDRHAGTNSIGPKRCSSFLEYICAGV